MKTILSTLNAKYIHTSLALRLLYVANKTEFELSFQEFTIKEPIEAIAQQLISTQPDVIGLGVYIWNVLQTEQLINRLKELNPAITIIIGGPEVTYEPAHFLSNWSIDFVISGEGEFVLGNLLRALENGTSTEIEAVSSRTFQSKVVAQADLQQLAALPSPYQLKEDDADRPNKLLYFETSRGCPYQCQYCLSSLEKGVRYFPLSYIEENLRFLINSDVKQIKFLDRTFNLNPTHTFAVFEYLIKHHRPNLSCQFEVYADLLTPETIELVNKSVPPNYFRFEIGIQSTHTPTNLAVKRKQDFSILANNIQQIQDGEKIDLHLDLIAGLPYETFPLFVNSFNQVFQLGAKEIQLGFLKMLRGTNLRKVAAKHGYQYQAQAPYEIIQNNYLTQSEINRIKAAEHALEKYWNSGRFPRTMKRLVETHYIGCYFELFDQIGQFYTTHHYPHHGYQLENLFAILHAFLKGQNINLFDELRTDYYHLFTHRPTTFWGDALPKTERKRIAYLIGNDKPFLKTHQLTRTLIEKQTLIDQLNESAYTLTLYSKKRIQGELQTLTYLLS